MSNHKINKRGSKNVDGENFKELAREFEIFSNQHRLAILSYLKKKSTRSVGQIADNIKVSFKTTSKHLLYLARKGILKRRYDGPFVLYKISDNLSKLTRSIIFNLL